MNAHPTGEQLYQELCDAATTAGVLVHVFAADLYPAGNAQWKLEQMRIARRPLRRTIERVRALIRCEVVAPAVQPAQGTYDRAYQQYTRAECEAMGLPPSGRAQRDSHSLQLQKRQRDRIELMRSLAEQAHRDRRPGQPIADRVRELRLELPQ